jgi:hypothetical protein
MLLLQSPRTVSDPGRFELSRSAALSLSWIPQPTQSLDACPVASVVLLQFVQDCLLPDKPDTADSIPRRAGPAMMPATADDLLHAELTLEAKKTSSAIMHKSQPDNNMRQLDHPWLAPGTQ